MELLARIFSHAKKDGEVIGELLDHLKIGAAQEVELDAYIGFLSIEERSLAVRGAKILREAGKNVDLQLRPQKAKKLFSAASKAGARYALFIGPQEREKEVLAVKDLESGRQEFLPLDGLAKALL